MSVASILAFHLQAVRQSVHLLCCKPLISLMTTMVIAIALALPALFWIFSNNLAVLLEHWQRGGTISLYLKLGLPERDQQLVLKKIIATEGVAQAFLKSSADGLAELMQQEGMRDMMRYLPENPLPAVIEVKPTLIMDSLAKVNILARQLQHFPQVEHAQVDMQWVSHLYALLGFVSKLADALMILLAMAVMLIIGTTLRAAIHSRQKEIQVLKLIGAKDSFILRPFLYSGAFYGLMGAVFAIFLVNIFILSIAAAFNQLVTAYQIHYFLIGLSLWQILLLIFFAIILGWLGALLPVKWQLTSIEPQL